MPIPGGRRGHRLITREAKQRIRRRNNPHVVDTPTQVVETNVTIEAKMIAEAAEARKIAEAVEARKIAEAAEAKKIAEAAEAKKIAEAAEAKKIAEAKKAEIERRRQRGIEAAEAKKAEIERRRQRGIELKKAEDAASKRQQEIAKRRLLAAERRGVIKKAEELHNKLLQKKK